MMNERGSFTVDFTFGLILVGGVSFILVALCLTLTVVEVTQYVAFSVSRSYFSGDISEKEQLAVAEKKFSELTNQPGLKQLLKGQWFEVKLVGVGDFRSLYPPQNLANDSDTFFGSRLQIEAKVLNIRVPFFGSTARDEGYKAHLNSFLGREPSFEECAQFESQRWDTFKKMYPLTGASSEANREDAYTAIMDNGC